MISVNVSFIGRELKSLIVRGHANFDSYGKDIVCAGVSSIITGGINALEKHADSCEFVTNDNELGIIVINSNHDIQVILSTILIQLETIEQSYKKYVQIEKKHGGV